MPRGDGTGPMGMGPMTGRAAGYCAGYGMPGYMNPYGGRGRGMAWGRGGGLGLGMAWRRGWGGGGAWAYGPPAAPAWGAASPEQEMQALRAQADWLKQQMDAINQRIQQLESAEQSSENE